MTTTVENLRDTIVPKSDQLNADDLMQGPMTVKIESVKRGDSDEQPVAVGLVGHRPYKPCKTMRRVLITAWGDDGRKWVGNSMTLYCDPEVKFGGVKVGGIRISHMTGIDADLNLLLTSTRSRRAPHKVERMEAPVEESRDDLMAGMHDAAVAGGDTLKSAWSALTAEQRKIIGQEGLGELKKLKQE